MKAKKSFVLYHDYWNWFRLLTDEEIGLIIRGIFYYEKERVFPEFLTDKTLLVFQMIKEVLDRDRAKHEKICIKNSENAKIRWQKNEKT